MNSNGMESAAKIVASAVRFVSNWRPGIAVLVLARAGGLLRGGFGGPLLFFIRHELRVSGHSQLFRKS